MSTAEAGVPYRPRSVAYKDRTSWLALRTPFIGSSEAAVLFGVSSHTTERELYHRKRGELPEVDLSDNVRVLCGTEHEAANARVFATLHGVKVRKVRRILIDDARRMSASIDYEMLISGSGWSPLELKSMDGIVWAREVDAGDVVLAHDRVLVGVELPVGYQVQLQHQLAVAAKPAGFLGVVVGGNRPYLIRMERHDGVIAELRRRVAAFWDRVERGDPPPLVAADDDVMKALYREGREDAARDLRDDPTFADLCAAYVGAGVEEKALADRRSRLAAELRERIGDHDAAFGDDGWRAKWPAKMREADQTVTSVRKAGPYRGALSVTRPKIRGDAR